MHRRTSNLLASGTFVALLIAVHTLWAPAAEETKPAAKSAPPTARQLEFFESKVRPILVERCQKCHDAEKHKGGLRLDSGVAILAGGDSGPALVPGNPKESLLIQAIKYESLEMPPTGKLADREIETLTEWVRIGAPWPAEEGGPAVRKGDFEITDDDRKHWAFVPIVRPAVPAIPQPELAANPIDHFIQARLHDKGLTPNPTADKRTLIRRLYFDLIGLPPTAEEIDDFVADDSPLAYEQLVDRLLASPHYGERWGRHWLDLVRYAQTNGYERDDEKPEAWRFRDYVIRSFNADKPYSRFIQEQLAGDELDDVTRDAITATGYYHFGIWDDEPDDRRQAEFDELDDMLKTTGTTFLGLSLGCARCHDHKFDPIGQEDYYRLLGFIRNIELYGTPKSETHYGPNENGIFTPIPTRDELAAWKRREQELQSRLGELKNQVAALEKQLDASTPEKKKRLEDEMKRCNEELAHPPFARVLSVREPQKGTKETHVLIRGSAATPGKQVAAGVPTIFGGKELVEPAAIDYAHNGDFRGMLSELGVSRTPGLRRKLAEWVSGADNPLVARVFVNRVWQHHFGRGIVRSSDNFGRSGDRPTHPHLLDWLAREFIDSGFQVKRLQRLIVMSNAYRMSSTAGNPAALAADTANELFWRQNLRRLDAEAIRDAMLTASGKLNTTMEGRGIFPALSQEVLATQSRPGNGWGKSSDAERGRRSVYVYVKRTLMVPMLEAFDATSTADSVGVRPVTTVAPQALILLNSEFTYEQSAAMAERVTKAAGTNDADLVAWAFRFALGRTPTVHEAQVAADLLARQQDLFRTPGANAKPEDSNKQKESTGATDENIDPKRKALRSLCLVLLNLNEFVYVD